MLVADAVLGLQDEKLGNRPESGRSIDEMEL